MTDLHTIKHQTAAYIGYVFDHVSGLGHTHLLGHLYDFQTSIESEINRLTNQGEVQ